MDAYFLQLRMALARERFVGLGRFQFGAEACGHRIGVFSMGAEVIEEAPALLAEPGQMLAA